MKFQATTFGPFASKDALFENGFAYHMRPSANDIRFKAR